MLCYATYQINHAYVIILFIDITSYLTEKRTPSTEAIRSCGPLFNSIQEQCLPTPNYLARAVWSGKLFWIIQLTKYLDSYLVFIMKGQ